jgi:hypothetical protein
MIGSFCDMSIDNKVVRKMVSCECLNDFHGSYAPEKLLEFRLFVKNFWNFEGPGIVAFNL